MLQRCVALKIVVRIVPCNITFIKKEMKSCNAKGDVTRDDSQRRLLAPHSVASLLPHCFEWLQHCSNIATLCRAINRRCESFRVTSGSFSNDDGDGSEAVKTAIAVSSKTIGLHVHHAFLYIS